MKLSHLIYLAMVLFSLSFVSVNAADELCGFENQQNGDSTNIYLEEMNKIQDGSLMIFNILNDTKWFFLDVSSDSKKFHQRVTSLTHIIFS